jgi:hypothetical protein
LGRFDQGGPAVVEVELRLSSSLHDDERATIRKALEREGLRVRREQVEWGRDDRDPASPRIRVTVVNHRPGLESPEAALLAPRLRRAYRVIREELAECEPQFSTVPWPGMPLYHIPLPPAADAAVEAIGADVGVDRQGHRSGERLWRNGRWQSLDDIVPAS